MIPHPTPASGGTGPAVPPQAPLPGTQGKSTAGSRWRMLTVGLLLLGTSVLGIGCFGLARGIVIAQYSSDPTTVATYDGMSSSRSGSGRSTSTHCSRSYTYAFKGEPMHCNVDSPCLILLGPNPEPGDRVTLAYDPDNGRPCVSEVEVYALDHYLGMLLLIGTISTLVSAGGLWRGLAAGRAR